MNTKYDEKLSGSFRYSRRIKPVQFIYIDILILITVLKILINFIYYLQLYTKYIFI
jgi:hypothetical protein